MFSDRRLFLTSAAAGVLVAGCSGSSHSATARALDKPGDDDEVTPVEDLMREHGVLRRVMYLYDDAIGRLDGRREVPLDALVGCAGIVRRVIEDYHEKLEEDFLFPRYEQAGVLADVLKIATKATL